MGRLLALASASVLMVIAVLAQSVSHAAAQDTAAWDNLVAAAKREGRVVVIGPPYSEVRQALPTVFKNRYGITVEYLGGSTSEQAARLRAERSVGQYTVDVTLAGIQSMTGFYREKMLMPLRPELIMAEVVDRSKWKKGELWFLDPEQKYVLRLTNYVSSLFHINTSKVNPSELGSARDLLDPKWRGKIAIQDPTVPGNGNNLAAQFYVSLGEDFVKQLYIDQKPMITRDSRQLTDWLLRGTYPIAFGADAPQIDKMRSEGMTVSELNEMPDMRPSVIAGFGLVALFDHMPHPAAAKLFANWMASKEGLETWARATQTAPARNDIDEASFLAPEIVPRPGVSYFDGYDWEFTLTTKEAVRLRMKDMLAR
jgi:iron(III) transport system substrate-binding protein